MFKLYLGDSLEQLKQIPDNSVDSMVTDPPAGISFMGTEFDSDKGGRDKWIEWLAAIMVEAMRTLKPGAHALVWALPRTSHWTMTALEDAGFEIRDVITHLFAQGMPKSMNIAKAIDKSLKVKGTFGEIKSEQHAAWIKRGHVISEGSNEGWERPWMQDPEAVENNARVYVPGSEEASRWVGWGTALKPGAEYWVLCRKPLAEKTLTANILKHGAGGINIEACRIGLAPTENVEQLNARSGGKRGFASEYVNGDGKSRPLPAGADLTKGRWPSSVIVSHHEDCVVVGSEKTEGYVINRFTDGAKPFGNAVGRPYESVAVEGGVVDAYSCHVECPRAMLDKQSGPLTSGKPGIRKKLHETTSMAGRLGLTGEIESGVGDSGGASRFYYCPKASKKDKGSANLHPTVKSTALMEYLIKLITPTDGIVLDPFMGSGSTGVAAVRGGWDFIGIELSPEYLEIASRRINEEQ